MTPAVSTFTSSQHPGAPQRNSTDNITSFAAPELSEQDYEDTEMTRASSLRQPSAPQPANPTTPSMSTHTSISMARPGDSASDNETSERPVREKLKQTSIATLPEYGVLPAAEVDVDDRQDLGNDTLKKQDNASSDEGTTGLRGRPTRKRSLNDLEADGLDGQTIELGDTEVSADTFGKHARKRSRDMKPEEALESHVQRTASEESLREEGEDVDDKKMSDPPSQAENLEARTVTQQPPELEIMDDDAKLSSLGLKKKRSRDQFDKDLEKEAGNPHAEDLNLPRSSEDSQRSNGQSGRRSTRDQPVTKRHRDISLEAAGRAEKAEEAQIPPTSGFANTSVVSPFGTLAGSKSPERNSASVMKSTVGSQSPPSLGFASLSDSGASPFGTLGASSSKSPFGGLGDASTSSWSNFGNPSGDKSDRTLCTGFSGGSTTSNSGFGIIGASAFGNSTSSGFGKLGTGFGGAFGGGTGGLKSFAAKGGSDVVGLSDKPSKPFGAPAAGEDDEESGSNAENDAEEDHDDTEVKEDKRFHQQELETGEEEEVNVMSCRAKLFANSGKEWKERGQGTFKLNILEDLQADHETSVKSARLLMRADGSHRVVLNTPIFKSMKIGDRSGKAPSGGSVLFTGIEDGKPVPLLLKLTRINATELYDHVMKLQTHM